MKIPLYSIVTVFALVVSSGCLPSEDTTASNDLQPRSPTTTAQSINRPSTKPATLSVEGEPTPVTLRLFEQQGYTLSTYFPERFEPVTVASGEGESVQFYFTLPDGTRQEDVYVSFFFPRENLSVQQMENYLLGSNGIFAVNQWQVSDRSTTNLPTWATERISFRHTSDPRTLIGNVYIGQIDGQVFSATVHYPAEYAEGVAPRATTILENVQLR